MRVSTSASDRVDDLAAATSGVSAGLTPSSAVDLPGRHVALRAYALFLRFFAFAFALTVALSRSIFACDFTMRAISA